MIALTLEWLGHIGVWIGVAAVAVGSFWVILRNAANEAKARALAEERAKQLEAELQTRRRVDDVLARTPESLDEAKRRYGAGGRL